MERSRIRTLKSRVHTEGALQSGRRFKARMHSEKRDERLSLKRAMRMGRLQGSDSLKSAPDEGENPSPFVSIALQFMKSDAETAGPLLRRIGDSLSVGIYSRVDVVSYPNLLAKVAECLHEGAPDELALSAAWCATSLCAADTGPTVAVMQTPIPARLLARLASPSRELIVQCLWALGNIAGDTPAIRAELIALGAVEAIAGRFLAPPHADAQVLGNAAWALANLSRSKEHALLARFHPHVGAIAALACRRLGFAAEVECEAARDDAMLVLSHLTDASDPDAIRALFAAGTATILQLVAAAASATAELAAPALRVVGNVLACDASSAAKIIRAGALESVAAQMKTPHLRVLQEALWCAANAAAGPDSFLRKLFDLRIVDAAAGMCTSEARGIRREAVWLLANASFRGDEGVLDELLDAGIVEALVGFLSDAVDAQDEPDTILAALDALANAFRFDYDEESDNSPGLARFEAHGGISALELLHTHPNEEVYDRAAELTAEYFSAQ